ncbi:hypothetical protein KUC74_09520 [Pseudomonas aeruginosa]|uniref:hypothetical protein n=1 Tax=Pseudomonas aeruginosa TaxID=287 RepID=UPI00068F5B79|nr:hypothetical protein [Pseudomonas aeruginosa]MCV0071186.1 hypothetical protein [Pseudomonas aeruginosa]MDY1270409.1 hypothetical protein [Pseudomonas aeruginosa]HBN8303649.1 hypothetical protein [Pseudomonas aeruginosa]HBN8974984.1 hypothetical protein [Pseudomonas aeruginosa]HCI2329975.1 hypothetical protein [Pseudomonas aeruginosa]
MTKANECTCPSGDGSLRHPCPAHPASVELAGVAANLTFINGRPAMCGCQVEYSSGGGEYSDVIYVTLCAKHSGSAILDLVATNRIALTPEYEGQWHADLYLDREIPLAKAEGATPAEAVLALMSAERIDPEQESVEQAGGDERAAFEAAASKLGIYTCNFERYTEETAAHENRINARVEDPVRAGDYRSATLQDCWKVWQEARAALAQPSPALPPFAEKVLDKLRRFYDCASDFESGGVDIGRHWLDLLTQLGLLNRVQRSPALWEISQQGEDLLGAPQHFPARTEQANSGYDQLWAWFGLSRSAYAVLPRVMMHAMPDDWQRRFAELMNEWDDHWPNQPDINARVHITQNGLYISTPKWLLDYRHPDHNQLNAMRGKDEL